MGVRNGSPLEMMGMVKKRSTEVVTHKEHHHQPFRYFHQSLLHTLDVRYKDNRLFYISPFPARTVGTIPPDSFPRRPFGPSDESRQAADVASPTNIKLKGFGKFAEPLSFIDRI